MKPRARWPSVGVRIAVCVAAGLGAACSGSDAASDGNLAHQPRPNAAASGASPGGSGASAAGSFAAPDNPTATPTWTGANAAPPPAAAPPPRRAAADDDAGMNDRDVLDSTVSFSWPESSTQP